MVSVLCCGPCFDDTITEDETLYTFLDNLLEYDDPKVIICSKGFLNLSERILIESLPPPVPKVFIHLLEKIVGKDLGFCSKL
jgi:hypothetical protein